MPIHDWTRVDAGLFHAFHQRWISALCDALNTGGLPTDYFALPEQSIRGPIPDVLTLNLSTGGDESNGSTPGLAVAAVPPRAGLIRRAETLIYTRKADPGHRETSTWPDRLRHRDRLSREQGEHQ